PPAGVPPWCRPGRAGLVVGRRVPERIPGVVSVRHRESLLLLGALRAAAAGALARRLAAARRPARAARLRARLAAAAGAASRVTLDARTIFGGAHGWISYSGPSARSGGFAHADARGRRALHREDAGSFEVRPDFAEPDGVVGRAIVVIRVVPNEPRVPGG